MSVKPLLAMKTRNENTLSILNCLSAIQTYVALGDRALFSPDELHLILNIKAICARTNYRTRFPAGLIDRVSVQNRR